jgi:hypothetical protein
MEHLFDVFIIRDMFFVVCQIPGMTIPYYFGTLMVHNLG